MRQCPQTCWPWRPYTTVEVLYSEGVPFCELADYLTIVAARDSGGCIAFHPVDEIRGCP